MEYYGLYIIKPKETTIFSGSQLQYLQQGCKEEYENNFGKQRVSDDYLQNVENTNELQEISVDNAKSIDSHRNYRRNYSI